MTKYAPLDLWLRRQQAPRVTLRFQEIEGIIGGPLPASSRAYEPHWRGTTSGRPGGAIVSAGWRVEHIDWMREAITLIRVSDPQARPPASESAGSSDKPMAVQAAALTPTSVERHAAEYFSAMWSTDLAQRRVLVSGQVPKSFDLVSSDGSYVGDAKKYTNIAVPAAKWSAIAEYVWLLQHVDAEHRFLVFGGSEALVAERFLKRWRAIVEPVEFYHLTESGHRRL